MLQKDFFTETIDQLSKELLYLVFYFQGEPYLNPSFLDMVAYASKKESILLPLLMHIIWMMRMQKEQ